MILYQADGPVATITLNRPEKLNAIGLAMRDELVKTLDSVTASAHLRALVITGQGRGFSARGDIEYLKKLRDEGDEAGFKSLLSQGPRITQTLRQLPIPVIAAIN